MPFCPNCGARVGEGDRFCTYCGRPRQAGQQIPVPVAPAPDGRSGAHKVRVQVEEAEEPIVKEDPEERARKVRSSQPFLTERRGFDKTVGSIVWMMRGFPVVLLLIMITAPRNAFDLADFTTYLMIFVMAFALVGGEYINRTSKLMSRGARLEEDALFLLPVSIYPGIRVKGRRVVRQEITKVDMVRSRDASPSQLATSPHAGIPTSLAFHTRDGKIISLTQRSPHEITAAAEYVEVVWELSGTDPAAGKPLSSSEVYRTFENDHHSTHARFGEIMTGAMMVFFIGMGIWALFPLRTVTTILAMVMFGMAGFAAWAFYQIYRQGNGLKTITIEKTGFEADIMGKKVHVPWSEVKGIVIARPDMVMKERERIAVVHLKPKKGYVVTTAIGEAIRQAYRENTNQEAPDEWSQVQKKGGYSADDVNTLKHENPQLFRKNNLLSAALFIMSIVMMLNVVFGNRIITLLGIILVLLLLMLLLQTRKDMKDYLRRRKRDMS